MSYEAPSNFHKSEEIYSHQVDGELVQPFAAESIMTCDFTNGIFPNSDVRSSRQVDRLFGKKG